MADVLELTSDVDRCRAGLKIRRVLYRVLPAPGAMACGLRLRTALGTALGIMNDKFVPLLNKLRLYVLCT